MNQSTNAERYARVTKNQVMLDRILVEVSKYLDAGISQRRAGIETQDDIEHMAGVFVRSYIEFLGKKHHHEKHRVINTSSQDVIGEMPETWFDHLKQTLLNRWPKLRRLIKTVRTRQVIHTTNVATTVKIYHDITNICPHLQYTPERPAWERGMSPLCLEFTQLNYDAARSLQNQAEALERHYREKERELESRRFIPNWPIAGMGPRPGGGE
jgi:hypothetical protein